jgi:SAM-dependent methyltransferase
MSQDTVRDYYSKQRYNEAAVDIIDASTDWYGSFAMQFVADALGRGGTDRFVELGCGQGRTISALDSLSIAFKQYIGIDLFVSKTQWELAARDKRVKFVEGDIEPELKKIEPAVDKRTAFLSVNALCYLHRLDGLLAGNLGSPAILGDDLIIVEPYPSIYWESWFDGISIYLRYPSQIWRHVEKHGWELREIRKLYLFQIGNFHFWPVSIGLHFECGNRSKGK